MAQHSGNASPTRRGVLNWCGRMFSGLAIGGIALATGQRGAAAGRSIYPAGPSPARPGNRRHDRQPAGPVAARRNEYLCSDCCAGQRDERMLLRFVDGRPVSGVTTQFLAWCCQRLAAQGKTALLLVWDNASWHVSKAVRTWIRQHNRAVKHGKASVRVLGVFMNRTSP